MEQWEIDFHWLKVRHYIRKNFNSSSLPDLETILFLIGVQELGSMQTNFSKDEKMQLIHIGTATLLSEEGYFKLEGKDEKGWPNWVAKKNVDFNEKDRQLKSQRLIIGYFDGMVEEE